MPLAQAAIARPSLLGRPFLAQPSFPAISRKATAPGHYFLLRFLLRPAPRSMPATQLIYSQRPHLSSEVAPVPSLAVVLSLSLRIPALRCALPNLWS